MEFECIIFNSELEFRKYVIQHVKNIQRVLVFEDELDQMIFFYCFTKGHIYVSTKELSIKDFSSFKETYSHLASELHLNIGIYHNDVDTLEFIRE